MANSWSCHNAQHVPYIAVPLLCCHDCFAYQCEWPQIRYFRSPFPFLSQFEHLHWRIDIKWGAIKGFVRVPCQLVLLRRTRFRTEWTHERNETAEKANENLKKKAPGEFRMHRGHVAKLNINRFETVWAARVRERQINFNWNLRLPKGGFVLSSFFLIHFRVLRLQPVFFFPHKNYTSY